MKPATLTATVSPTHCVDCNARVKPGDWTCGTCSEPRMRYRGTRVKSGYRTRPKRGR